MLVRDVCEFYRLKPSEVLKNQESLRISELVKGDILQSKENSLLFQRLSMLTVTELPTIKEESVKDLMQICLKLSNSTGSSAIEAPLSHSQKERKLLSPEIKQNASICPTKMRQSPLKSSFKHSPKENFKEKLFEQKKSPKNSFFKDASKTLPLKKKTYGGESSSKPSTSGYGNELITSQPAVGKSKPSLGVFDLTSDEESTEDEFPAWEPSSDLKVVKYRHDNIELVSKSSASKMKRKL